VAGVHKKGRPAGRLKPVSAYAKYFYASRPFSGINTRNAIFDTDYTIIVREALGLKARNK